MFGDWFFEDSVDRVIFLDTVAAKHSGLADAILADGSQIECRERARKIHERRFPWHPHIG